MLNKLFEDVYLEVRMAEGRLYDDSVVSRLPEIGKTHPLAAEWSIRQRSLKRFMKYLHARNPGRILEIGCGNGWMSRHFADALPRTRVVAVDANEMEIEQARRLFFRPNLQFERRRFIPEDLGEKFDLIVLASSLQYFRDGASLIRRLFECLLPDGEIHVMDTPFYRWEDIDRAKKRTVDYFTNLGFPEMIPYYHHHGWHELEGFFYEKLFDPDTLSGWLNKIRFSHRGFPWIRFSLSANRTDELRQ
jgi:SAM-dependent methyltransferase